MATVLTVDPDDRGEAFIPKRADCDRSMRILHHAAAWYGEKAPRTTALLLPCPWSGDEHDPIPASYRWWFRLYRASRIVRHWLGLHDWQAARCTWCGRED